GGLGSGRARGQTHYADKWIRALKGEISHTRKHIRGHLSMMRPENQHSALRSFFIVLPRALNQYVNYSFFSQGAIGCDTLDQMEKVQRNGESPIEKIVLIEASIKP